jgi:hypothetical protein
MLTQATSSPPPFTMVRQLFLLALLPAVAVAFMGKCIIKLGGRKGRKGAVGKRVPVMYA